MTAWDDHLPAAVTGLVERVWLDPGSSSSRGDGRASDGVVVTSGRAAAGRGAECYAVLPARGRPRLLLPTTGRAAAGVVTAGPGLRPVGERTLRAVLGVAVRTGLPDRLPSPHVTVLSPAGLGLVEALQSGFTQRVAAVGFSVRPITPNHKPTFVAVDGSGSVLGYGKIGWDPQTRQRVADEARLLHLLRADPRPGLHTAAPVCDLTWRGRTVLVTEPLPASARRFPRDARPPTVLVEQAAAGGQQRTVREQADALLAQAGGRADDVLGEALHRQHGRLVARWGDCALPAGIVHGDWVPWNLATDGRRLWAWDWEHGQELGVPALDLVHWHLQVARLVRGVPLAQAVGPALEHAAQDLAAVGTSPDQVAAVGALGVLQMVTRRVELAALPQDRAAEFADVLDGAVRA